MSLHKTVIEMVRERGSATVDDLAPHLPAYTRAQVQQALRNAQSDGWLSGTSGRGRGLGMGRNPSTYTVREERKMPKPRAPVPRTGLRVKSERHELLNIPRVSSVFALGDLAASTN